MAQLHLFGTSGRSARLASAADTPLNDGGLYPEPLFDLIPRGLADAAQQFSTDQEQCTFVLTGSAALSAVFADVSIPFSKRQAYANLFVCVIAESGGGKNSSEFTLRLVRQTDLRWMAESEAERASWETAAAVSRSPGPEPKNRRLILGGDATTAGAYLRLDATGGAGVIHETEGGIVAASMAGAYGGGLEGLLLKAFHAEPIAVDRKGDPPLRIDAPRPAVSITATPPSARDLFRNLESGLYQRFIFLQLDISTKYVSQFDSHDDSSLADDLDALGERVDAARRGLERRRDRLPVRFARHQIEAFDRVFEAANDEAARDPGPLLSATRRTALSAARLAAVLTAMRRAERGWDFAAARALEPDDDDVAAAIIIARASLFHAARLVRDLEPAEISPRQLSAAHGELFDALPNGSFRASQAKALARELNMSERSVERGLRLLTKSGKLQKLSHGTYVKVKAWRSGGTARRTSTRENALIYTGFGR